MKALIFVTPTAVTASVPNLDPYAPKLSERYGNNAPHTEVEFAFAALLKRVEAMGDFEKITVVRIPKVS